MAEGFMHPMDNPHASVLSQTLWGVRRMLGGWIMISNVPQRHSLHSGLLYYRYLDSNRITSIPVGAFIGLRGLGQL